MDESRMGAEKKVQETINHTGSRAVETMTIWADANQRVLNELVELGTAAAKESVKLFAELQQNALDALRDSQAATLRWQAAWQEAPKDPVAWYQKTVVSGVEGAQKSFRLLEGHAQVLTRTAERLQASAEQAGRGFQETFTTVAARMKDTYVKS
jgi:hypothetical protein